MGYFLAIDIPDDTVQDLKSFELPSASALYHQRRADLHITLAYLGPIPEDQLDNFIEKLCTIEAEPFSVSGQGVRCFGPGARYRNYFLTAAIDLNDHLKKLKDQIDRVATACGFPPRNHGDGFQPHITLARSDEAVAEEDIERFKQNNADAVVSPFQVTSFALYQSQHPKPYKKICDIGMD